MRVQVLKGLAGNQKPYPLGRGVHDLPDDIAKDLISRGLAQPLLAAKQEEKAEVTSKKPTQKRAKRTTKKTSK